MFFKKNPPLGPTLLSIVEKRTQTAFVYVNINNDLGHAAGAVMQSTPKVRMAYGYARRTAAAAMYVQGLVGKDVFDHVCGIFKALQQSTGQTVQFQEDASADADNFLKSYHHLIGGLCVNKLLQIAQEYDVPEGRLSDQELMQAVMDTLHAEQDR